MGPEAHLRLQGPTEVCATIQARRSRAILVVLKVLGGRQVHVAQGYPGTARRYGAVTGYSVYFRY